MTATTDKPAKKLARKPKPEKTEGNPAPAKLQRRPALAIASVALIAAGGLGGFWVWSSSSDATPVVAVRDTVNRGETIDRSDLMTVNITVDPALKTVDGDRLSSLVGKRAAMDIPAGGIVTNEATSSTVVPGAGQSMVGVSLTTAQMPSTSLHSGDRVRIVQTPGSADSAPAQASEPTKSSNKDEEKVEFVSARVVGTPVQSAGNSEQARTVVNVLVPTADAANLASQAATGRVALVLDTRER